MVKARDIRSAESAFLGGTPSFGTINLKWEFDRIVEETGWWMLIRRMRLGEYSEYWDRIHQVARGGPRWKYDLYLVKGRRIEQQRHNAEKVATMGLRQEFYTIYFIKSDIPIKKEDQIIELWEGTADVLPRTVHVKEAFDIQMAEHKIDKKLIFNKCYCDLDSPKGDITLKNGFQINIAEII